METPRLESIARGREVHGLGFQIKGLGLIELKMLAFSRLSVAFASGSQCSRLRGWGF